MPGNSRSTHCTAKYKGSANLFAEVWDISMETPYGDYTYTGGHRLWHAPEGMPRSYIPDNEGLVIGELPNGLLPNRHFSLWPYSHIHDPRLRLEDEYILIEANPNMPPFKIGTFNPRGWSTYWLDGMFFEKLSPLTGIWSIRAMNVMWKYTVTAISSNWRAWDH
jgi:hypothetical protein